jgi:hypothetical protein
LSSLIIKAFEQAREKTAFNHILLLT